VRGLTRRSLTVAALALLPFLASAPTYAAETVRVGIMSAEDEGLWAVVAQRRKRAKQKGLTIKLVVFNDYTQPNEALENRNLDANPSSTNLISRTKPHMMIGSLKSD
jgi:D-methionine transport system substrate-binding protein